MKKTLEKVWGFTLVELIVVITILASLIILSISFLDPIKQVNKFTDGKRQEDLQQIKTALDTYYNDFNCYPPSLSFGSPWVENTVTYMRKVPQDPDCSDNPTTCYIYQYSGSCPQWTVVFAKLSKTSEKSACQLASLSSCVPAGYDSSWACTISGNVDCAYLSGVALEDGSVAPDSTPTPTIPGGGSGDPPTPTPTPPSCSPKDYACTGNPSRCNFVPAGTGTYCTPDCAGAC